MSYWSWFELSVFCSPFVRYNVKMDISRLSAKKVRLLALAGEVVLVTAAGHQSLADQMRALDDERKRLEHELGETAIDYPDLRENATYDMLSGKLNHHLPRLVGDLRDLKFKSRLYTEKPKAGWVTFGQIVELETDAGVAISYWLTGPVEASAQLDTGGVPAISYVSPLGQLLWGTQVGQTISLPKRGAVEYTILGSQNA